jgi:hypothetical protein
MNKVKVQDVQKPILEADPEVRRVITRVLSLEKDKLYLQKPHIVDDVVKIIKEEVTNEASVVARK